MLMKSVVRKGHALNWISEIGGAIRLEENSIQ